MFLSTPHSWSTCKSWSTPEGVPQNCSFSVDQNTQHSVSLTFTLTYQCQIHPLSLSNSLHSCFLIFTHIFAVFLSLYSIFALTPTPFFLCLFYMYTYFVHTHTHTLSLSLSLSVSLSPLYLFPFLLAF